MPDTLFIGQDVHKPTISVAVARGEHGGEVGCRGTIPNRPVQPRKPCEKLAGDGRRLHLRQEAGPCGCGLHRQMTELGHDCAVVAPSLIPVKAGDRMKTDRRDAAMLAKLHRAGEPRAARARDAAQKAMRDPVRARATAVRVAGKARRHLQGFVLRLGRIHPGRRAGPKPTAAG